MFRQKKNYGNNTKDLHQQKQKNAIDNRCPIYLRIVHWSISIIE